MARERFRGQTGGLDPAPAAWELRLVASDDGGYLAWWRQEGPVPVRLLRHSRDGGVDRLRVQIAGVEREIVLDRTRRADSAVAVGLDGFHAHVVAGLQTGQFSVADAAIDGDTDWLRAPYQSVVVELLVAVGDVLEPGQPVLRLEAMKVVNTLTSPRACVVDKVCVTAGQSVEVGYQLVGFAE